VNPWRYPEPEIGQRFNHWTVVGDTVKGNNVHYLTLCRCDCGVTRRVQTSKLYAGLRKSCGCARWPLPAVSRTPDYRSLKDRWRHMKNRCYDPSDRSYRSYGGRGITVCHEWLQDFATFVRWASQSGYRRDLQLDRIDNDGPYAPNNCRWVSHRMNLQNRRRMQKTVRTRLRHR